MKFGKTFITHQIPEWSVYYMNYKHLKKRIKTIDLVVNQDDLKNHEIPELIGSILAEFFFELDRDIEKVDEFYNKQSKEYTKRLNKILVVLGWSDQTRQITHQIKSSDELDEIILILLELRTVYRNLKWYGELNHKGFVKILKKLDKKLNWVTDLSNEKVQEEDEQNESKRIITLPMNHKDNYLSTRVNALLFANGTELHNGLGVIGEILVQLGARASSPPLEAPTPVITSTATGTTATGTDAVGMSITGSGTSSNLRVGDANYSINHKTMEKYYNYILDDDSATLLKELGTSASTKSLITLLNRATSNCSYSCIREIFQLLVNNATASGDILEALYDVNDISGRNFFHHQIISLGKKQVIREAKKSQADFEKTKEEYAKDFQEQQEFGDYGSHKHAPEFDFSHRLSTPGGTVEVGRFYGSEGGPDGASLISIKTDGVKYLMHEIIKPNEQYREKLFPLLNSRDNYQRTPLHYAAQYGLKDLCEAILEFLIENLDYAGNSIDNINFWGDQEQLTPLHLAIIGKHPKTTEILINKSQTEKLECPSLLLLAVRLNEPEILNILINQGKIDINYTDLEHNNETALYIASKLNLIDVVRFLINLGASTEYGEVIFGWTPIFIAASEGFNEIVKILLESGCKYDYVDDSGWLPMEHACLRGHLDVADALKPEDSSVLGYDIKNPENNIVRKKKPENPKTPEVVTRPPYNGSGFSSSSIDKLPESNKNIVNEVYKQLKQLELSEEASATSTKKSAQTNIPPRNTRSPLNKRKIKPVKSFGHKFLNEDESMILITLGTTDLRDLTEPIELNKISMAKTFFTELDTALSLVITCRNKSSVNNNQPIEPPVVIDLPLEDQHGNASDPITFKLSNGLKPQDTIITFDVVPTYQYSNLKLEEVGFGKSKKVLGRAVAIMENAYTRVGPNLRSLNNNITVPIIESSTLDILGSIRFEYMYVTSFTHPSMNIGRSDTYWKQLVSTRVIGHRGLGKNVSSRSSLQLGENTVESFIAAASLGASYVEFDVQLTKDFIPVIYHDFTVAESGVDIPMHSLTAEQFLGLSDNNKGTLSSSTDGGAFKKNYSLDDEMLSKIHRPRSMSTYTTQEEYKKKTPGQIFDFTEEVEKKKADETLDREVDQINRRMKHTKTWKSKGFKGNARGMNIASNFVTLEELFKKIPSNVGFNMELKYPMLDEAEQESMGEIAIDINFFVDTILKSMYDHNKEGRNIIFSSFHPDVCLLLSLKQPTFPILFLSESGTAPMADIRASSLQNAIRFSKKWNLLGIVSAAQTIVKTPKLAQVVKSSGLVCVTYGVENNSPELAKIQMKAGVDAVIADSVLAVREGLRNDENEEKDDSEE